MLSAGAGQRASLVIAARTATGIDSVSGICALKHLRSLAGSSSGGGDGGGDQPPHGHSGANSTVAASGSTARDPGSGATGNASGATGKAAVPQGQLSSAAARLGALAGSKPAGTSSGAAAKPQGAGSVSLGRPPAPDGASATPSSSQAPRQAGDTVMAEWQGLSIALGEAGNPLQVKRGRLQPMPMHFPAVSFVKCTSRHACSRVADWKARGAEYVYVCTCTCARRRWQP